MSPEQKQSKADLASSIKPFHGFGRDIHIARELFYAMGKTADPNDAEAILEPITGSNDETKRMIEAFRNEMSPNCAIIGCAACGRRFVLDHMKPIPDHLKIPIIQLTMLKVPEAALAKINLEYIKFYDIISVKAKPETSYYYLHRRYMEDPSSETNPLTLQSRAILCVNCKNKCSQNKGPPERSIANG